MASSKYNYIGYLSGWHSVVVLIMRCKAISRLIFTFAHINYGIENTVPVYKRVKSVFCF